MLYGKKLGKKLKNREEIRTCATDSLCCAIETKDTWKQGEEKT